MRFRSTPLSLASLLCAFGLVLGLLLAPTPAQAQSSGSGSIYSRFGVGALEGFSSSQAQALGGGAYALRSLNYNAIQNPALWSDQVYTRFLMGGSFRSITVRNNAGQESDLRSGSLDAVHFSFPIYREKLGLGLAFQPYSQSNFRVTRERTLEFPDGGEAPYRIRFDGSGGLNLFRAGLGYRVADFLRVGGALDLVFGVRQSRRSTQFLGAPDDVAELRTADVVDEIQLFGATGTFGLHFDFSNVLMDDDALSIGASATLPATLSGDRSQLLQDGDPTTDDDTLLVDTPDGFRAKTDGEIALPSRYRFGISYQFDQRWTFVADGEYGAWSNTTTTFAGSGRTGTFPVGGVETLDDRWRMSTGVEVVPGGDDRLASYFARTAYRLGGYVEQSYVQPDPTNDVDVWGVTGGLSLPTPMSGTRIDLNGTVGRRGSTSPGLVRDTFYGVSLFVSFGERWFQERKLR